jgi:hypothetical protein
MFVRRKPAELPIENDRLTNGCNGFHFSLRIQLSGHAGCHGPRRAGSCFENRADNLSPYGAIFHLEYEGLPTLTCVFIGQETDHARGRETQSASQSA